MTISANVFVLFIGVRTFLIAANKLNASRKYSVMALEKKRKKDTISHDSGLIDESGQATIAKRAKVAPSHNLSDVKEQKHMEMAGGDVLVNGKVRKRIRKKRLYDEICQQMEFYFGDANMSKSKFMSEEIGKTEGGWLNLDIFLRFNKLVEMMKTNFGVATIEDLWNSLSFRLNREKADETKDSNSILEIRENEMGVKQVRRSKPLKIKTPEDVEKCTIYIENLPPFVTHDSLKKMFSEKHGPVDYVSLPRYKHNRAVKGFAFIEFANVTTAEAAINMFEGDDKPHIDTANKSADEVQRMRPADKDPAELQSIKSFQLEQAIEHGVPFDEKSIKDEKAELKNNTDIKEENLNAKARHDEESKGEPEKDVKNTDEVSDNVDSKVKSTEKDGTKESLTTKKKKRRHKNKYNQMNMPVAQGAFMQPPDGTNINNMIPLDGGSSDNYVFSILRIMTKEEWRKMRNKYLNLQKQNMSIAKGRIRQTRPMQKEKNKEVHPNTIQPHTNHISSGVDAPVLSGCGNKGGIEFVPSTIVRFKLEEPIIDQGKQIKSRLRAAVMEPVKYVDATNGKSAVFVRCSSQKQAEVIASAKNLIGSANGDILAGTEESEYWEKISSDRDDKISGRIKVKPAAKKERGKDRVVRKFEENVRNTHKFFDDGGVDE